MKNISDEMIQDWTLTLIICGIAFLIIFLIFYWLG